MGNITSGGPDPKWKMPEEEKIQRQYEQRLRELKISLTRGAVVRSQILRAYEILENIRFDFVGDSMFRGYIVEAKKSLEGAMNDFLVDDTYHRERIREMDKLTPGEYDKQMKEQSSGQCISSK